jgi:hypothetical protein
LAIEWLKYWQLNCTKKIGTKMFNVEVHVTNRVESYLVRLCIRFLLTLAIGALTFGNSTSFAGNISCLELLNKLERFQSSSGSPLNSVFKLMEANKRKISTNSLIRIQSIKEALHKKYSPMLVEIEQTEDFSSRDSLLNIVDLAVRLDLASAVTGQSLSQDQVDTLISAHIYGRPPYSAHDLKAKINILKRSFPQQVINDFLRLGITGEGEISLSRDNVIVTSPTTSHQDSHLSGVNSREAFERAKTLPLESFLRGPAKTLAPLFTREVYPESQTLRVKGPGNGAVVTIDLEFRDDPRSPQLIGELQIPGYSNYLQPYDDTHIIGIGKNTASSEKDSGFVWYQGMKLGLFDVTNPNQPIQLFKTDLGDRGTDSPALTDHHALLFSKDKNLLAFPVNIFTLSDEQRKSTSTAAFAYGQNTFQGLIAYNLDLVNGFKELGRITHMATSTTVQPYYYGYGADAVKRSLYIGDKFYVASDKQLTIHKLFNLAELGLVKF